MTKNDDETDFATKHEQYITSDPPVYLSQKKVKLIQIGMITPSQAKVIIDRSEKIRPPVLSRKLKLAHMLWLARQMKEGKFVDIYEPIKIGHSGEIVDARHRLYACVESGVPVELNIRYGVGSEIFSVLDTGTNRSTTDTFFLRGVENPRMMSVATRCILHYCNEKSRSSRGLLGTRKLSNDEIYEYYLELSNLQNSLWVIQSSIHERLVADGHLVALHYIFSQLSDKDADEFFRKLVKWEFGPDSEKDNVKMLVNRLVKNLHSRDRLERITVDAFVIKVWNNCRTVKLMKQVQWRGPKNRTEKFPTAI